jgi:chemotaxis protein MotB
MPDVNTDLCSPAGEEFEGNSYLASLSDLMVGMLFVFILMLMAFALTYRTAQQASEQSNQQLQSKLNVLGNAQRLLSENDEIRRRMLESLKEQLARRRVQVIVDEQSGVLRLPDDLLFDSGEAKLRRGGIESLKALASTMAAILPCYSRQELSATVLCPPDTRPVLEAVYIEGHTDDRPIKGIYENNWGLSTARAVKTYGTLIEAQPSLLNLRNLEGRSLLGVSGYGEARPVASNDSAEGQAQNRRIDLRFILAAPSAEDLERIKEGTKAETERDRLP